MRKLAFILLSLLFCSLSAFPQSRQVRVTTKKGSVFEGTLKEFKAFEHLIVEVNGKNLLIPYETMAYIDDITPKAVSSKEKNISKESRRKGVKNSSPAAAVLRQAQEPSSAVAVVEPVALDRRSLATNGTQETPLVKSSSPAVAEPVEAHSTPSLPISLEKKSSSASSVLRQAQEPSPAAAVVEPVAVAEPVEAPHAEEAPHADTSSFKGFLLSPGNNVYLHCTSDSSDESYDAAALDVLKRQFRRYNFWTIVDNPAEAHFTINYTLQLQGSAKTVLSISSDRTANQETLGTAKGPEDTDDYRKIVYELFQKYLLPLQSKISKNTPPKRTQRLFTLE